MTPAEFRAARKALGLTQETLGEALGLHRQSIHLMEKGDRPVERRTVLALRYLGLMKERTHETA